MATKSKPKLKKPTTKTTKPKSPQPRSEFTPLNDGVIRFVDALRENHVLIEGPVCAAVFFKPPVADYGLMFLGVILPTEIAANLSKLLEDTARNYLRDYYGQEVGEIATCNQSKRTN